MTVILPKGDPFEHWTPLHFAIQKGDEEKISILLRSAPDLNSEGQHHNPQPLVLAIEKSNLKIIRLLVAGGASVNYIKTTFCHDSPLCILLKIQKL